MRKGKEPALLLFWTPQEGAEGVCREIHLLHARAAARILEEQSAQGEKDARRSMEREIKAAAGKARGGG